MSQTDCPSKYRLCNTRNDFILKLGNTPNNNSIFNTKHAEFSTIRFPLYVSVHFSPTHLIMQPHLHSLPTMPSSPEPFLTSLFHLSFSTCSKNNLDNPHRHYLSLQLRHPANSGCVKYLASKGVCEE